MRLFSFGGYGLALGALALVGFDAYDSYSKKRVKMNSYLWRRSAYIVVDFPHADFCLGSLATSREIIMLWSQILTSNLDYSHACEFRLESLILCETCSVCKQWKLSLVFGCRLPSVHLGRKTLDYQGMVDLCSGLVPNFLSYTRRQKLKLVPNFC